MLICHLPRLYFSCSCFCFRVQSLSLHTNIPKVFPAPHTHRLGVQHEDRVHLPAPRVQHGLSCSPCTEALQQQRRHGCQIASWSCPRCFGAAISEPRSLCKSSRACARAAHDSYKSGTPSGCCCPGKLAQHDIGHLRVTHRHSSALSCFSVHYYNTCSQAAHGKLSLFSLSCDYRYQRTHYDLDRRKISYRNIKAAFYFFF